VDTDARVQVLEPGATLATGSREEAPDYALLSPEAAPSIQPLHIQLETLFQPPTSVVIGSLPDDRLRLLKPIRASIQVEEAGYIACNTQLEEYGYGRDVFEAVEDLQEVICELYWSLDEDEDRLSEHLRDVLNALRDHIEAA